MNQRIRSFKILKLAFPRSELHFLPSYVDLVTSLVNDSALFAPLYSSHTGGSAAPSALLQPPNTVLYDAHAFNAARRTPQSDFMSPYVFTNHDADPTVYTFNSDVWCTEFGNVLAAGTAGDDACDRRIDVHQGSTAWHDARRGKVTASRAAGAGS